MTNYTEYIIYEAITIFGFTIFKRHNTRNRNPSWTSLELATAYTHNLNKSRITAGLKELELIIVLKSADWVYL